MYISKAAAPSYNIPSPAKLREKLIPRLLEESEKALKAKLDQAKSITVMLDLWSSKAMDGYLGLSCKGVTKEFEPFHGFLDIPKLAGSHTGKAICEVYKRVVKEYNLHNKVYLKFWTFTFS